MFLSGSYHLENGDIDENCTVSCMVSGKEGMLSYPQSYESWAFKHHAWSSLKTTNELWMYHIILSCESIIIHLSVLYECITRVYHEHREVLLYSSCSLSNLAASITEKPFVHTTVSIVTQSHITYMCGVEPTNKQTGIMRNVVAANLLAERGQFKY